MTSGVSCTHCGLPVPGRIAKDPAFCCQGCATVHSVLTENGLEGFYSLREESDALPARTTESNYAEFDDATFLERHAHVRPDGALEIDLFVPEVHCAACLWVIEKLPTLVDGVERVRLELLKKRAKVVWRPDVTGLSTIARQFDRLGYPPQPYRGVHALESARAEERDLLVRMGISGAMAGNVMMISFALYGGLFHGMNATMEHYLRWASLLLTVPAVLVGGSVFMRGALRALTQRVMHMDLPVSLGILVGTGWGAHNTLLGHGEIYFDTVTALIFLLLAGRFLQRRQLHRAAQSTDLAHRLVPNRARRVSGPSVHVVAVESLATGDRIEVLAGDTIPVDGIVFEGATALDRSLMTGESLPERVGPGDTVLAGTVNVGARIHVTVAATLSDTRAGRILKEVERQLEERAPVVGFIDSLAGWFVAVVLALSGVTFLLWLPHGLESAVANTVALLVITCPCALGLATPLAVGAALSRAAGRGILFRSAKALEVLSRTGQLWLDKTGTLTEGRLQVIDWTGDPESAAHVVALERHSSHPVARALVRAFESSAGTSHAATEVEQTLGGGIRGRVAGSDVIVGSPAFVRRQLGTTVDAITTRSQSAISQSVVDVAVDGKLCGRATLHDPPRSEAATIVRKIRESGWTGGILSGDAQGVVKAVARKVDIANENAHGALLPEDKLAVIKQSEGRPVVMVGDGVNDAAALAEATVGIAVHGGVEVASTAADVVITRPGLEPLADVFEGSRRTMRVVYRNLAIASIYNVVGVTLAMSGHVNPLVAALLMPLSSATVIFHSFRSRSFDRPSARATTTGALEPAAVAVGGSA